MEANGAAKNGGAGKPGLAREKSHDLAGGDRRPGSVVRSLCAGQPASGPGVAIEMWKDTGTVAVLRIADPRRRQVDLTAPVQA